jgi:hypothetical protein
MQDGDRAGHDPERTGGHDVDIGCGDPFPAGYELFQFRGGIDNRSPVGDLFIYPVNGLHRRSPTGS